MKTPNRRLLALVVALLPVFVALGQTRGPAARSVSGKQQAAGAQVTINQVDSSAYPRVAIFASVTKDTRPLKGLGPADFVVREDGIDQTPLTVVPKLTPLNAVVVLDTSGSMRKRMNDAKAAAKRFVEQLPADDQVQVISFAQGVKLLSNDGNRTSALASIDTTAASGDTALYDALYTSISLLKDTPGRKAIALLSDGADDNGAGKPLSKHTLDEALALARLVNVPVFAIGLGTGIDKVVLTKIAEQTGGLSLIAPSPTQLTALYARISEQLAGQYYIYYTSRLPGDGREHEVQLQYSGTTGSKPYLAPLRATPAPVPVVSATPPPRPQPTPALAPPAPRLLNLLARTNGGEVIVASDPKWQRLIDGVETDSDPQEFVADEAAVFAFKGEQAVTFDNFGVLIPSAAETTLKDFELSAGNESATGTFQPIGIFHTQNAVMLTAGGWQDFKFSAVTARYLKMRVISSHGRGGALLYELRVVGRMADSVSSAPAPAPQVKAINLLTKSGGATIVEDPEEKWSQTFDGDVENPGSTEFNPGEEAVFGFGGGRAATFDRFAIAIPSTEDRNVKDLELLGGDSARGPFSSLGKFHTENARMARTGGWQSFQFAPATAKFVKVKLLSAHGGAGIQVVEFALIGSLN